jgi:hypothetical protein
MNKMSFEELVDKLASFKWDGSLDQADQFSKLIIELLSRHADLQAYKADIENAIKGAMDDNPNEKHCSCVPLLKVKIKQLADLQAQAEQGKKAIELVEKIFKISDLKNTLGCYGKIRKINKLISLAQPDGLTKGERGK